MTASVLDILLHLLVVDIRFVGLKPYNNFGNLFNIDFVLRFNVVVFVFLFAFFLVVIVLDFNTFHL